jgi:hypothetical protein
MGCLCVCAGAMQSIKSLGPKVLGNPRSFSAESVIQELSAPKRAYEKAPRGGR